MKNVYILFFFVLFHTSFAQERGNLFIRNYSLNDYEGHAQIDEVIIVLNNGKVLGLITM
ncbi:MAG: hypothetical protein AAFP19_17340 [Bacteroidota bacterium]